MEAHLETSARVSRPILSALTLLAFLAVGATGGSIGPALPSLAQAWGVPLDQAGTMFSLFFLGVCFSTPVEGFLIDRIGRKPVVVAGQGLIGAGLLGISLAPDLTAGLLAALVLGVGFGSSLGLNVLMTQLYPGRGTQALNLAGVAVGVGALAAPLLVGFAAESSGSAVPALTAIGVYVLLISLSFSFLPFPPRPAGATEGTNTSWSRILRLLREGYVLVMALLFFIYFGAESSFSGWIFSFARQGPGVPEGTAALAVTFFWATFTLSRLAAGIAARWIPGRWIVLGGVLIAALGAGLIAMSPASIEMIFLGAVVAAIGCGPVFPTAFALVAERYPASAGVAGGIVMLCGSLGGTVLPAQIGSLLVGSGVSAAAGAISLAALAVAVVQLFIIAVFRRASGVGTGPASQPLVASSGQG